MIALLLSGGSAACGSESVPGEEGSDGAVVVAPRSAPVAADTAEAVAARARPVAAALMSTLSGRLQEAIAERGTAGALEFCNVEALPLTAQVVEDQGMEVVRTSLRLRNPANAPDDADAEALAWYQDRLAAGEEAPALHVRRLDEGGYRYYQPLMTAGPCLQCHGPRASLAADVIEALDERYPEDRAVGYSEGDWRGLLRISVPEAAVAEPPPGP